MLISNTINLIRPNLRKIHKVPRNATSIFSETKTHTSFHQQHQHQHQHQQQTSFRYANTTSRPFKILGLQQVAVGSTDAASMQKLWVETFGLEKIGNFTSEKENVAEDILKLGSDENGSVSVEVDLMCPLDEEKSPKVSLYFTRIRRTNGRCASMLCPALISLSTVVVLSMIAYYCNL